MSLYLSRLTLSRRPQAAALRRLVDPPDPGRREDAHHRLLWTVFGDDPDRRRDFLWRAESAGRFLALSARPPDPAGAGLFEPPEVKDFAPDLRPGDRLSFVLRANATVMRTVPSKRPDEANRKVRDDVVMAALKAVEPGGRAEARMRLAQERGAAWLDGQGARHGFRIPREAGPERDGPLLAVTDYSVVALPHHRGKRENQPQFGVLDMTGTLEVVDPAAFLAQLPVGFGRAKAFGCGLMLVRRA